MPIHIGLLGAMPEEVESIVKELENLNKNQFGDLTIFNGELKTYSSKKNKIYVSVAWSGWGKVSAARATTRMCAYSRKILKLIFNFLQELQEQLMLILNNGI